MSPNKPETHGKEDPLADLYAIVDSGTLTLAELHALEENLEARQSGGNSDKPLPPELAKLIERLVGVISETDDLDEETKESFIKATLAEAISKVAAQVSSRILDGLFGENLSTTTLASVDENTVDSSDDESSTEDVAATSRATQEFDEFSEEFDLPENKRLAAPAMPSAPSFAVTPAPTLEDSLGLDTTTVDPEPTPDEATSTLGIINDPTTDPGVNTAREAFEAARLKVTRIQAELQALGWTWPFTAKRARKTKLEAALIEAELEKSKATATLREANEGRKVRARAHQLEVAKPTSKPVETQKATPSLLDTFRQGFGSRARLATTLLLGGALALGAGSFLKNGGSSDQSPDTTPAAAKADTPTPSEAPLPAPESTPSVTASTTSVQNFTPSNTLWEHFKDQGLKGSALAEATNAAVIAANLHLTDSQLHNPKELKNVTKEMAKWGGYKDILKNAKDATDLEAFLNTIPADQKSLVEGMAVSVLGPISIELPAAPQKAAEQAQSATPMNPMDAPLPGMASQAASPAASATTPAFQKAPQRTLVDPTEVPEPSLPNRP